MYRKILILIVLFTPMREAFAQALPKAKEVYKNNYANEIFGKTKQGAAKDSAGKSGRSEELAGNAADKDIGFVESNTSLEAPKEVEEDLSYESKEGNKIIWLGAIINSTDSKHTVEKLKELNEEANKYDLMVGPVFLVGNTDIASVHEMLGPLQKRQGLIDFRSEIPKKYKEVKSSPTWIMQTEKGQILLEGTGALKRNFNKSGQLVLPE